MIALTLLEKRFRDRVRYKAKKLGCEIERQYCHYKQSSVWWISPPPELIGELTDPLYGCHLCDNYEDIADKLDSYEHELKKLSKLVKRDIFDRRVWTYYGHVTYMEIAGEKIHANNLYVVNREKDRVFIQRKLHMLSHDCPLVDDAPNDIIADWFDEIGESLISHWFRNLDKEE